MTTTDPPGSVQRGTPDPYPEHTRLAALGGDNQTIGEFVEWLSEQGYIICEWSDRLREDDGPAGYVPLWRTTQSWIAEYFQIDPAKIEAEKRAMLDLIRQNNEPTKGTP